MLDMVFERTLAATPGLVSHPGLPLNWWSRVTKTNSRLYQDRKPLSSNLKTKRPAGFRSFCLEITQCRITSTMIFSQYSQTSKILALSEQGRNSALQTKHLESFGCGGSCGVCISKRSAAKDSAKSASKILFLAFLRTRFALLPLWLPV